eukprot:ctg_870.g398
MAPRLPEREARPALHSSDLPASFTGDLRPRRPRRPAPDGGLRRRLRPREARRSGAAATPPGDRRHRHHPDTLATTPAGAGGHLPGEQAARAAGGPGR